MEKKEAEKKGIVKKSVAKKEVKPKNLVQGVMQVMKEVKGIEKALTVGSGNHSYKGVADKDVKRILGEAMERAGLIMLPIAIEPILKVDRWDEETNYGMKKKQSVFTEVKTTYKLMHESGEHEVICGYGHGVDSQDKGAGKATTYALKYALLYTFLIPTGEIDDADKTHSKEIESPKKIKKELNDAQFTKACQAIEKGEYSKEELQKNYELNKSQITDLKNWK
tara:strand:+ start:314 stop:982 length:669 start_codon:yes stop_codon:yes gene_type:complete